MKAESFSKKSSHNEREKGDKKTQMNQKKVRGLRWKDILTCETVVWGGQKSLGARLR